MKNNSYLEDSKYFLKHASKNIKREIENEDLIQITFNIALGTERLMKGIIYSINPIYVLKSPEFFNSFPTLYKKKIVNKCKEEKIINQSPDEDVITYRQSLARTQIVSKIIFDNKAILYKLGDYRDIIAHCNLSLIDYNELRLFIYRDFYPLISSLSTELKIPKTHFFDNSSIRIAKISSDYQDEKAKQIQLKLEASHDTWEGIKDDLELVEISKQQTKKILDKDNTFEVICPSCDNSSVLFIKPVYEYIIQLEEEIQTDFIPELFVCKFCKLRLTDSSHIDELIMPTLFDDDDIVDITDDDFEEIENE